MVKFLISTFLFSLNGDGIVSERKRKRGFDLFDFDFDEEGFPFGHETGKSGSGYSISVTYDEKGKPVVQVKTYGDVDTAALRKDIEQRYPGARIEGLEKQPLIRVVEEKETEREKRKTEKEKSKAERKEDKKSLIKVIE